VRTERRAGPAFVVSCGLSAGCLYLR
jgi:hypothetical protein